MAWGPSDVAFKKKKKKADLIWERGRGEKIL